MRHDYARSDFDLLGHPTALLPCFESGSGNRSLAGCLLCRRPFSPKTGWSLGWISALDLEGRTIWIADADRGDGKRFVVRADEKLTAFLELELATRGADGRVSADALYKDWAAPDLTRCARFSHKGRNTNRRRIGSGQHCMQFNN